VHVAEAKVLGRVAFEGNKKVKDSDLTAAMQSKPRGSLQPATVANVDSALRDGKGVIMSSDADTLWATQGFPPGVGGGGRHAVVITNGLYDGDGKMTGVHVNDTGTGTQYTLTNAQLKDCLDSGSGTLNVTDQRIWPTD